MVIPLLTAALLFAIGLRRLTVRSARNVAGLERRAWLFGWGWVGLALALVSPLHEAGEQSFAAHMAEHEMLMLLAAPLLVLSEPVAVMLWAFASPGRRWLGRLGSNPPVRTVWRALTDPVAATLVQAAALWLWHLPGLFDLALENTVWHAVQHACFLVSALLFWSAMLHPRPGRAGGRGLVVLCLFATSMVSGALGAAMALSESPWYAPYARLPLTRFGLTPAEDQQLAGLLMWIPGGLVHAGAALVIAAAALRSGARLGRAADAL